MKDLRLLNYLIHQIEDSILVKNQLLVNLSLLSQVQELVKCCAESLKAGGKIIFAGNGGSFADAQHLSAEFVSRFQFNRSPLASIALGTNSSALTAIGNDYGYEEIFSRELLSIAKESDIFIPITTSGNSKNIVSSIKLARSLNLKTVCFTGQSGGSVKSLCECLCVPSNETARIQECHILLGHIVCGAVENLLFSSENAELSL